MKLTAYRKGSFSFHEPDAYCQTNYGGLLPKIRYYPYLTQENLQEDTIQAVPLLIVYTDYML